MGHIYICEAHKCGVTPAWRNKVIGTKSLGVVVNELSSYKWDVSTPVVPIPSIRRCGAPHDIDIGGLTSHIITENQ